MGKIYARLDEQKQIVEYPVLAEHIAARCHPLSWYTEVSVKTRPECPKFSYLKEKLYFQGEELVSDAVVVPLDFDEILRNYVYSGFERTEDKYFTDVTADVVSALLEAGKAPIQAKLDAYARAHGYDDIVSMSSYATDPDERYRAQSQTGVTLRSTAWRTLFDYFAEIAQCIKPVPKYYSEVVALLPAELREL